MGALSSCRYSAARRSSEHEGPLSDYGECCAGFFADKEADAKARGEDEKKKSKEEEFSDFMSSIAVDVQEAGFLRTYILSPDLP